MIFISFAGIKTDRAEGLRELFKRIITDIYKLYKDIMTTDVFDDNDRAHFQSVNDDMSDETAVTAINRLGGYLERCYDKKVIILLDEYDTPMQEAWLGGYWDEAVGFFRNFFSSTFKTNPHLHRGIITGITRISKESVFSDLNNLDVVTTTSDEYAVSFGFTQEEVFKALDDMGLGGEKQGVK